MSSWSRGFLLHIKVLGDSGQENGIGPTLFHIEKIVGGNILVWMHAAPDQQFRVLEVLLVLSQLPGIK